MRIFSISIEVPDEWDEVLVESFMMEKLTDTEFTVLDVNEEDGPQEVNFGDEAN